MNIYKSLFPWLLILATIIATGCHKHKVTSLGMSGYPNKVGDQWIYVIEDIVPDTVIHTKDTLTITIVSPSFLNGSPSLLWQYSHSKGFIDTFTEVTNGDTVNFYRPPNSYPMLAILFPVAQGVTWRNNLYESYSDSYLGDYSNLGQNYSNVFIQTKVGQSFNYDIIDNLYIAPNIGMVYRELTLGNGKTKQTWSLIKYHLD
ncbi:MAG: hypothetical protein JWO06_1504 [Bacteroidota bacterium]|nr:hypothetical protein [Bacteroidota bacterium]